jgi:ribosomal protein S18 acetylase RimI-like enzyme
MNFIKVNLRLIKNKDLEQVAKLHEKAFSDSALSKLGLEPIRRYYEWQLNGPHDCYAVGAFDENQLLIGFCFSGVFRGSLSGFLAKNKKFLIKWLIVHPWLVQNPIVMDRIKRSLRLTTKKYAPPDLSLKNIEESFGVLSIAVNPDTQGSGIGKMIMQAVESEARRSGFASMNLTVHPTNITAVAFYEGCGWKKIIKSSGQWSGSMSKRIERHGDNK